MAEEIDPAIEKLEAAKRLAAQSDGQLTVDDALQIITCDPGDPDLQELHLRIEQADRRKAVRFDRHIAIGATNRG